MKYPSGTLDLEAIKDNIYTWIYNVTQGVLPDPDGLQIVWRNQSEPLPPRPCVTMKFTYGPAPTDRQGNVTRRTAQGVVTVGIQQEATLSVQVFGNTKIDKKPMAYQLAVDLNSSLIRQSVLDQLKAGKGGVTIQGVGKPMNLTALEETDYEERAGFDLALGMVQNLTDAPGTIEQVNISGTVDGVALPTQNVILP